MRKTPEMMEGTHKRWSEDNWELEYEDDIDCDYRPLYASEEDYKDRGLDE